MLANTHTGTIKLGGRGISAHAFESTPSSIPLTENLTPGLFSQHVEYIALLRFGCGGVQGQFLLHGVSYIEDCMVG